MGSFTLSFTLSLFLSKRKRKPKAIFNRASHFIASLCERRSSKEEEEEEDEEKKPFAMRNSHVSFNLLFQSCEALFKKFATKNDDGNDDDDDNNDDDDRYARTKFRFTAKSLISISRIDSISFNSFVICSVFFSQRNILIIICGYQLLNLFDCRNFIMLSFILCR